VFGSFDSKITLTQPGRVPVRFEDATVRDGFFVVAAPADFFTVDEAFVDVFFGASVFFAGVFLASAAGGP
jgi:hypothetical protein